MAIRVANCILLEISSLRCVYPRNHSHKVPQLSFSLELNSIHVFHSLLLFRMHLTRAAKNLLNVTSRNGAKVLTLNDPKRHHALRLLEILNQFFTHFSSESSPLFSYPSFLHFAKYYFLSLSQV